MKTKSNKEAIIITGQSVVKKLFCTSILAINNVIPKTKPKLAMFEPIIFPMAKSGKPSKADLILTINSGAEVAKETTVIPIMILGILKRRDIETADLSKLFPPKINKENPTIINKKFINYIF